MKGRKKIFHANRDQKKAGVAILISLTNLAAIINFTVKHHFNTDSPLLLYIALTKVHLKTMSAGLKRDIYAVTVETLSQYYYHIPN